MEKIQGVKNFGNEGEGIFREILSCPPKRHVAPQMPPQIPRPGAATASDSKTVSLLSFVFASRCCNLKACSNEANMQHCWMQHVGLV